MHFNCIKPTLTTSIQDLFIYSLKANNLQSFAPPTSKTLINLISGTTPRLPT